MSIRDVIWWIAVPLLEDDPGSYAKVTQRKWAGTKTTLVSYGIAADVRQGSETVSKPRRGGMFIAAADLPSTGNPVGVKCVELRMQRFSSAYVGPEHSTSTGFDKPDDAVRL